MWESIAGLRRPLLIFHSPVDQVVGIDNAATIYEATRHPKSFVSLDDADHLLLKQRDSLYVACTTMTVRMYAERKKWPLEEAVVRLQHSKNHAEDEEACENREARFDRLDRELTLVGPLDEAQRGRLLEIADRCPVHRTLSAGVRITTRAEGDTAKVTAEG